MFRIALALLIYASLAAAQPWQWELTNPAWPNPTNFPQLSPTEFPVCIGDVTGDGLAEVMQFGVQDYLSVQDENGIWSELLTAGGPFMIVDERITACNLDSDPAQELVVTSDVTEPAITCYKLNTDSAVWTWELRQDLIEGRAPSLMTSPRAITWGSFDQDEDEEAAVLQQTIYFEDALFIFQRTGPSQPWTSQYEFVFTGMTPHTLYSGDFDRDGDTDIAVQVSILNEYEATMIFENSAAGIQWNEPDSDLLSPGGGDLDGDGEWEFLYLNSCDVHTMISVDGPYLLEWNAVHDYSFGRNLRDVSEVIGRLRGPDGSYVAGVSTFYCFNSWNPNSYPHSDIIDLSSADYRRIFALPNPTYSGLSMADINGDGLKDLMGSYYGSFGWFDVRWSVLMNVGDEFVDAFQSLPGTHFDIGDRYFPEEYVSPHIGDVDGDGRAELILAPSHGDDLGTIQIFRIEQLTPEQIVPRAEELEFGLPDSISSYEVTDLDGDGLAEILLVENDVRAAYFFRNGQWESYENILPNIAGTIRGFADWDNNGTMDIFADEGIYLNLTPSAADDPVATPTSFTLSSYPNPFNAQTTITFDLPRAGNATLKMFDVLGREIATLLDEPLSAGTHTHRFDAAQLPSGVYFAQLESGGSRMTHKLLLVK